MPAVTYTELREHLAHHLDQVVESGAALLVTRQGGKGNVVMIAESEFEGWQETVHLLRTPANAARLLRSVRDADAGRTHEQVLLHPAAAKA
ncbi:MAG: type II toxin-antitoxin system prevent-host-death family antitoxin [Proteobacteria bacterium]|nr:type II toxin-antitoxin system prevent-host-death family antitoxin [Pseudomonadota bacterium]